MSATLNDTTFRNANSRQTGLGKPVVETHQQAGFPERHAIEAIEAANRTRDSLAFLLTVIVLICIVASGISTFAWFVSMILAELSSWSLQDFMNGIRGY